MLWLGLTLSIALGVGSVSAQNSAKDPVWKEDHAGDAAKWLQHFINPMGEANYDSLRQIGYEQVRHMNNQPAMKALSYASWVPVAGSQEGYTSGRGQCLDFDPSGAIYYGVAESGLWKSTDQGQTWTSLSDSWGIPQVGGVAVDPSNPSIVYAGTGGPNSEPDFLGGAADIPGVGVYKSVDGGLNWTLLSGSPKVATTQMEVNEASPNIVYCASTSGVSMSDDGGVTWKNVLSLGAYTSIVIDPLNASIVYAAGDGDIEQSLDSGKTWSSLPSGFPVGDIMILGMSRVSSDSIYLSTGGGNSNGSTDDETGSELALSTDAGQTWVVKSSDKNYLGQQAFYANAMAVNPKYTQDVIAGGLNVYFSNNAGVNMGKVADWTNTEGPGNYVHADVHLLKYNRYTNRLFALTDGGIFYSDENGQSWEPGMNNTLNTLAFVGGDMAVNSSGGPDFFCAGAQDDGLNACTFGSSTYQAIQEGDGGLMYVSPQDGQTTFGTYTYMTLYRSEDRGADWDTPVEPATSNVQNILGSAVISEEQDYPNNTPFYIQYSVYDQDPSVVAVCGPINLFLETAGGIGGNAFPKVTNTGVASTRVQGNVVTVNIASSDDNYIYLGTYPENYFYYSTDEGNSWTKAAQSFGGEPTGISTDPNDPTRVFMTVAGTASKHFWFSTDNGQTWKAPATNLPALNYRRVDVDGNGVVYISNDFGVLRSGDTGKTWYPVADGLPMEMVSSLRVRGNYLMATTYGRGMYYVDLTQLAPLGQLNGVANTSSGSSGIAITAVYPSIITTSSSWSNVDYTLPTGEQTTLAVYDVLGREERMLVNEFATGGNHELNADFSRLAPGQHYLVLTAGGSSVTKPIIIQ